MPLTFLTIDEVASMLKLSCDTVHGLASSGKLPGRKVGRVWQFAAEEIEDYAPDDFNDRHHLGCICGDLEERIENLEETLREQTATLNEANRLRKNEIAERHLAEAYLRASMEIVHDALLVADSRYHLVLCNRAAAEILGTGETDAEPEQWPDIYGVYMSDGETPCPAIELPLIRAISGERVDHAELVIRNSFLTAPTKVVARATPIIDANGHLKGGVMVLHDLTDQKRAEAKYHNSEQRLGNLLDFAGTMNTDPVSLAAPSIGDALTGILADLTPPPAII